MNAPSRAVSISVFVVLTLIWGTTWAFIRLGFPAVPPFRGVALRFAIAAAVLFSVIRWKGLRLGQTKEERRLWLVVGGLTFCVSYGIIYWGEQWVPSGLTSVLFAAFPLLVGVLAHFFLPSERLGPRGGLGLALGFCGIALIFSEDFAKLGGEHVLSAATVVMISPLVSAISAVCVKRWGRGVHPLSLSAVPMAISAVVLGGVSLVRERDVPWSFPPAAIASLVYLALFGTALAFVLYYWILAHLPATQVSLISYLNPMVAVLVGTQLLHEAMPPLALAGSALVLTGVALAASGGQPQKRTSRS